MATLDAIGAVPAVDLSEPLGFSALGELPVQDLEATPISGTVTISANGLTATGTDTSFTSEVSTGDAIRIGDQVFVVTAVTADDSMTFSSGSSEVRTAQAASVVTLPTTDDNYLVFADISVLLDQI